MSTKRWVCCVLVILGIAAGAVHVSPAALVDDTIVATFDGDVDAGLASAFEAPPTVRAQCIEPVEPLRRERVATPLADAPKTSPPQRIA